MSDGDHHDQAGLEARIKALETELAAKNGEVITYKVSPRAQ
ncbi:MAG TPA: hypothetical protein VFA32_01295 [Dehalococcoidia bacterium]|nr:hypothetical protein [Dehalococcoidia bacterium]